MFPRQTKQMAMDFISGFFSFVCAGVLRRLDGLGKRVPRLYKAAVGHAPGFTGA